MSALFPAIAQAFPWELISHLAVRLGEGENGMKRTLGGVFPLLMARMARQARTSDARLPLECSNRAYQTTPYGLGSVTGMLGILGSGTAPDSALMQVIILMMTLLGNC